MEEEEEEEEEEELGQRISERYTTAVAETFTFRGAGFAEYLFITLKSVMK